MQILRFERNGKARLGVREGDEVVDLNAVVSNLPTDVCEVLRQGPATMQAVRDAATSASRAAHIPAAGLKLLPPAATPGKVICLGLNYVDHAAEAGRTRPDYPIVFFRGASSFVADGQPIVRPNCSDKLDYEGELVAFVSRRARHISREDALSVIGGYSVFNDASIRDYQTRTSQWTVGKNFDGTGGFGPAFVAADRLPPGAAGLKIETRLNGQKVQSANTSDMVFNVAETVVILSECMTLEPGDLLVMGTPGGVGAARNPQLFMKPGDVCEVEIEAVGLLRNPIVQEGHA
ncbi:MAG: 5-oxopent-3-ene-1,2,5-tricarboxylate decarboxylase [Rhodospirillales bacterium]|nr:5-oxopent-3-ene-1,2,5-tricarboxylate decarboxylase [Rhodospirillales bacterium]